MLDWDTEPSPTKTELDKTLLSKAYMSQAAVACSADVPMQVTWPTLSDGKTIGHDGRLENPHIRASYHAKSIYPLVN